MSDPQINLSAQKERHSQIDFSEGNYYRTRQENKKILLSFLSKTSLVLGIFMIGFLWSNQLVAAYPEIDNLSPAEETNLPPEVFVLGEDGFTPKIALNTGKSDRSGAHDIIEYRVESGDTLSVIAQNFGISMKTLLDNNQLNTKSILKVGQIIKILPVDGLSYVVKAKDSLASIAKTYQIKIEDIKSQNALDSDVIHEGQMLVLPGAKPLKPPAPPKPPRRPGKGGIFPDKGGYSEVI
ncbi:MAG TPA: LysM peptidoglycan-binding domain-containing protein, partial [Candidatus Gracilibacteria bacterium]|nr:LysM peptidoglycan-binding domain-containing protein [Candidatus Gracilibacteria bacterium]